MAGLAALTAADFPVGERLATPEGVEVEVAEVTRGEPSPHAAREPFSVVFAGADGEQGTYVLEHPVHGALELFLVPVGPGRLEAVFA